MYKRIMLASDGARESLVALREGAIMARALGAEVFLLIVEGESAGFQFANAVHPGLYRDPQPLFDLLTLGLDRLKELGVEAQGKVCIGEPALVIGETARTFGADLVIVGHRRQSLLERWWSGASGAYLVDQVSCSVLVARTRHTELAQA
jgi:nucleotide-binding universal stress UspA family protein